MKKLRKLLFSETWFTKRSHIIVFIVSLLATLPLIYGLVYITGGIKYVYSHTMYIPILLAGIFISPGFGIIVALIGGIILGPLMPIDTITHDTQEFFNWFYRLLIFILMGSISGFASRFLRRSNNHVKHLLTHHSESHLPNTNLLQTLSDKLINTRYMISTLMIHNADQIAEVLGLNTYYDLLVTIYQKLCATYKDTVIVQSDHHKFWIIKPIDDLEKDSSRFVKSIQTIKKINNIPIFIDFTVGTHYISNTSQLSHDMTFRPADLAAKLAKATEVDYIVYKEQKVDTHHAFEIISSFEEALKTSQTELYYQPKIDLNTLKPIGLEALIRWNHPVKGFISPVEFIPIIEQTKLIHDLTKWVTEEALKQIKLFEKQGCKVPISVNVSTSNINQLQFFDQTMELLHKYHVPASLIELEITEHVLMKNPDVSREVLNRFSKQGVLISVDDFGTGYSSLAYLDTFDINIVKLDRQFINKIAEQSSINQIVISTIELAKQLDYEVVAEGVETKEQLELIRSYGCHYAQGYYFAKPMKSADILKWYKQALK